jgi:hypothetical protein
MKQSTHQYFKDPAVTRLMGMVVALAGEVFVLKASHQRLLKALESRDALAAEELDRAASDSEVVQWMAAEKDAFARALLQPLLEPDIAQKLHDELFGNDERSS